MKRYIRPSAASMTPKLNYSIVRKTKKGNIVMTKHSNTVTTCK